MVLWIVYIEPTIGHMKTDGKLDRNWLKGHWEMHFTQCCAVPDTTSGCCCVGCSAGCGFFSFLRFHLLSILACVRLMLPDRQK